MLAFRGLHRSPLSSLHAIACCCPIPKEKQTQKYKMPPGQMGIYPLSNNPGSSQKGFERQRGPSCPFAMIVGKNSNLHTLIPIPACVCRNGIKHTMDSAMCLRLAHTMELVLVSWVGKLRLNNHTVVACKRHRCIFRLNNSRLNILKQGVWRNLCFTQRTWYQNIDLWGA